jgi:UDP-glucose 4-epimerase
VLEVLKAVERATGRKVPVEISPRRPGDAIALYADTTKVRAELGWTPRFSDIDTVVSTAWAFHRRVWGLAEQAAE